MITSRLKKKIITKRQLKNDFKKIGVSKDDHIAVTLSLKKVGYVDGGPATFIDALLETIGPKGTLMMNTFSSGFPIYSIDSKFVYESDSTKCYTGIVPETFRKRKGVIRSNHPCSPVAAIGKKAIYLTKNHQGDSHFAPYARLAKIKGKYLAVGLGNRLVAIRHQAQYQAGLFPIVKRPVALQYREKNEKTKLFICNRAPCTREIEKLTPKMIQTRIAQTGEIGNAQSLLVYAKDAIDFLTNKLKEDITHNLCDSRFCIWCRELERKLNLYDKIKNPRYFQKYKVIQNLFALRNSIALKKYNYLSYQRKSNPKLTIPIIGIELHNIVEDTYWMLVDFLNLRPNFYFLTQKRKKFNQ
jgi:aminoglycoside N3'-acetyltransferase